jgi:hypothetical protein
MQASRPTPPDLEPRETDLARRFAALARATPGAGLRERCLADMPAVRRTAASAPASWRWHQVAAAVLVGATLVAQLGSPGSSARASRGDLAAPLPVTTTSLRVVDDPSVPLFHGLETFQDLAVAQMHVAPMHAEGRSPEGADGR